MDYYNPCEYCFPDNMGCCTAEPCICVHLQKEELSNYWNLERDEYLFGKMNEEIE
jgi:hypothetical protein